MVIMATIKKSRWKGSRRLEDPLVINISNDEAQAELDSFLAQGFKCRFRTRSYKTELIHKFIDGVEHLILILWDA